MQHQAPVGDVERYQAEVQAAKDRIAALEADLASVHKDARLTRYSAALGDLRREYQFDVAEEMAEVQNYTDEQFGKHVKRIKERYQRLPRGGSPIRLADLNDPKDAIDGPQFTKEDMERAHKYQAENPGTEWRVAIEKTKGAANVARGA
jgi:hypothetical protein